MKLCFDMFYIYFVKQGAQVFPRKKKVYKKTGTEKLKKQINKLKNIFPFTAW